MQQGFKHILASLNSWQPGHTIALETLRQEGSNRQYFRFNHKEVSYVLTHNPGNISENIAFLEFTKHFTAKGLNVPSIVFTDPTKEFYVQSDLGDHSLFDFIQKEGFSDHVKDLFKKTCSQLARLQILGGDGLDYNNCIATRSFDKQAIYSDLLYFLYYFVRALDLPYDKNLLLNDFEMLSNYLTQEEHQYFMHRDCQSRNIMVKEGETYFIDYQGGMQGALQYDIASLLWQARAQMPYAWREELVSNYFDEVNELLGGKLAKADFLNNYDGFVLIRMLQTLGAYGFRGLFERKQHFISSIPFALKNLKWFLENKGLPLRLPALKKVLDAIVTDEILEKFETVKASKESKLKIKVNSFSYKKGIPTDENGNGGGYVFDCRGILNPGRIEEYKTLTGRDKPVQEFLMHKTNMPLFLQHVFGIVGISVEDYLKRDFEGLTINFGCTGGQHRSVYAADRLTDFLKEKYKVQVEVCHLEQEAKNWINERY
jgi:aminoglycoside/choline kinase family phosphotransferase